VLQLTTRECADVHCSVLVPTLMTGLANLDVFLNMLAKSVLFVRPGFLHHSMNGAVSCVGSALLMLRSVSRLGHYW
jgi:hypothetical protein